MNQLIAKASTLLEALPYIQRFRGETFVTKYGGSFMDSSDPTIRSSVARDIVFLEAVGINPVVVHGGGKAITQALADSGVETKFEQGPPSWPETYADEENIRTWTESCIFM